MTNVARMSVSLESDLVEQFNQYCEEGRFATRSAAVEQLVREALAARASEAGDTDAAATLTLVYDHHKSKLTDRLLEMQHGHHHVVVATLHVHLDQDNCLEVIVLRGKARELREMAAGLRGLKGVHTGQLVLAAAGAPAPAHGHGHGH
jgi:CopG family nickel-responsive transcriptional regulator